MSNEPTTTATLYYDANDCWSWLEFLHQPDDAIRADLSAAGWRWRPYREAYSTNARFPRFPGGVQISMGGEVTYSAERAERWRSEPRSIAPRQRAGMRQAAASRKGYPSASPS